MIRWALLFSPLLLVFLVGCAGWRPAREVNTYSPPAHWSSQDSTGSFENIRWWRQFEDDTLSSLIHSAFQNNLTLAQQVERLRSVRAQYAAQRASWFPTLSASARYTEADRVEEPEQTAPTGAMGGSTASQAGMFVVSGWNNSLTAAYELDLFGKLHAGRQSAHATWRASREELRAYCISLSAQVARSWYAVLALREQVELLEATEKSYRTNLEMVRSRYESGVRSSLDVYQAQTNLAGSRSQLAQLRTSLASAEHQLAVLLGRYPDPSSLPSRGQLPENTPEIGSGLPSELLARRPDVSAAWARVISADRNAASAHAARLPSFNLTASITGYGDELEASFDPENMLWQTVGSMTAPLFQGGRLKAQADAAEAGWRQSVAAYHETVLNAYREVEDALVAYTNQREAVEHARLQVQAANASLELATDRYLQGLTDYLQVVVAQTTALNARRSLISARQAWVNASVDLAVALGGDWSEEALEEILRTRQTDQPVQVTSSSASAPSEE